jgi:hypothetical protein
MRSERIKQKPNRNQKIYMRTPKRIFRALALVAVAGAASQASATLYTIGAPNTPGGFDLTYNGTQIDGGNSLVGAISLTPSPGQQIVTVCTDIKGVVYIGSQYNFVQAVFNGATGYDPNWAALSGGSASTAINDAAYIYKTYGSYLTSGSQAQAAAVQLAVWKVLYDQGDANVKNFGAGIFTVAASSGDSGAQQTLVNTAISDAQTFVTAAVGQSQQYVGYILQPTDSSGHPTTAVQEMLYNITPVPEPTTIVAGALLLLPFGASTLRFFRKNRTA